LIEVIIQLAEDVSLSLQNNTNSTGNSQQLLNLMSELNVKINPLHPGTKDPSLITWFSIKLPDETKADEAVKRLKMCKGVEAAYKKPPMELP